MRVVPSPGLSVGGRSPVTAFLAAGAARQRLEAPGVEASHQERNRADRAWSASLDDLCAWAGEVLAPVLDGLDLWPRALCESGLVRCPAHPRPFPGVPDTATATATATGADAPGENAGSGTPETAPVPKPTPVAAGTEGAMPADDARGPAAVGDASVTASGTHRAGDAPGAAGVVGGAGLVGGAGIVGEGGAGHACAAVRLVLVPGASWGWCRGRRRWYGRPSGTALRPPCGCARWPSSPTPPRAGSSCARRPGGGCHRVSTRCWSSTGTTCRGRRRRSRSSGRSTTRGPPCCPRARTGAPPPPRNGCWRSSARRTALPPPWCTSPATDWPGPTRPPRRCGWRPANRRRRTARTAPTSR